MPIAEHAALALVDYRRLFACVCNGVSCNGYIYGKTEKFKDANITFMLKEIFYCVQMYHYRSYFVL